MPADIAMRPGTWGPDIPAPPREAFEIDWVIDPVTRQRVIGAVHHAGHAYAGAVPRGSGGSPAEADLQAFALRYLRALQHAFAAQAPRLHLVDAAVLDALAQPAPAGQRPFFHWLPLRWGDAAQDAASWDAFGSFWVQRHAPDAAPFDRTAVLLAGRRFREVSAGQDIGLRLALHVSDLDETSLQARLHGVVLSCVDAGQALGGASDATHWAVTGSRIRIDATLTEQLGTTIAERLQLNGQVLINAASPATMNGEELLLVDGRGCTSAVGGARQRWFRFSVAMDAAFQIRRTLRFDRLVSHANPAPMSGPRLFQRDPAGLGCGRTLADRRPTRRTATLLKLTTQAALRRGLDGASVPLACDGLFQVLGRSGQSLQPASLPTDPGGTVLLDKDAPDSPRSDASAAAHVAWRAQALFQSLIGWGLPPAEYFRHAELPLMLKPRAALHGAPLGEGTNAEVRPFWSGAPVADAPQARRPRLLVKFGSAEPAHRDILALNAKAGALGRRRAQYLSVAADPRWAWHEFGHVLTYAATGEMELPFAHSVGDALAAISGDPESGLAWDPALRFVTFPWVQVPGRNHGRSPAQGYGWCGRRCRLRLDPDAARRRLRHGYFEEQLLSSSLFRLYRCLGGDTRSVQPPPQHADAPQDTDMRLAAADHCMYLIVRALSLLGSDAVAPARTVGAFVGALMDADLGTAAWPLPSPGAGTPATRRGGWAHKVIRWAFEQQGLYATDDPTAAVEGTGLPPAVDVYIADRRPSGPRPDVGGYAPVPLRYRGSRPQPWHASDAAVRWGSEGLDVRVANRGRTAVTGLSWRLWSRSSDTDAWQEVSAATDNDIVVNPGDGVWLRCGKTLRKPAWLLAHVHAAADPSNLPLGEAPPAHPAELMALVAHDNNLALWPPGALPRD